MSEEGTVYRIPINKPLIREFFMHPLGEATASELKELHKVITVVLNTHFGKYYYLFRDLRDVGMESILLHHPGFDPASNAHRAYGFVYTMLRNDIGNRIRTMCREQYPESLGEGESLGSDPATDLPVEIEDLIPYLSGTLPFTELEVKPAMIEPLLLFLEHGSDGSAKGEETVMRIMRKILLIHFQ